MLTHFRYDQDCNDFPKMLGPHRNSRSQKENVTYCHLVSTQWQLTYISILETDDNYGLKYNLARSWICATRTPPPRGTTAMFMQIHYKLKRSPHNGNATDISGSYLRRYVFRTSSTAHGVTGDKNDSNVIYNSGHSETPPSGTPVTVTAICQSQDPLGDVLRTRPQDSTSPSSCALMAVGGHCGRSGRIQTAFSSPYNLNNKARVDAVG